MKRSLCLLEAKHPLVYDCLLKNKTCLYGKIFLRILEHDHDSVKGLYTADCKNCVGKALLYQVKDSAFFSYILCNTFMNASASLTWPAFV